MKRWRRTGIGLAVSATVVNPPFQSNAALFYGRGEQVFPAAWSPAGELIVTVVEGGKPHIWVVSPKGERVRQLRGPSPNSWAGALSPSGEALLVESYDGGVSDLFRVDLASGKTSAITSTRWNEWHASWSPDGRWIVFDTDSAGPAPQLILHEVATGRRSRLTNGRRAEQGAKWSPDGTRLAFHRHLGGATDQNYDVFIIDHATRGETQVTNDPGDTSSPAWSPDGTRLAFSSNRTGQFQIFVACTDGTNSVKITDGSADKKYPLWSPDGTRIAYQVDRDGVWAVPVPRGPACRTANTNTPQSAASRLHAGE